MEQNKVNEILKEHCKWLSSEEGKRADLQDADLRGANLQDANLQDANLRGADLRDANLQHAYLQGADLQHANFQDANLQDADLQDADLRGANIDFSCLPLWCGGLNFKIDEKQAKQLLYHVINLMQYSDIDTSKIFNKNAFVWLRDSHLVIERYLPILQEKENE